MSGEDLAIVARLIQAGAAVFTMPPCPGDDCSRWSKGCKGSWHRPSGWETTQPGHTGALERWQPGWALAMVTGHLFDVLDIDPRNGGSTDPVATIRAYGIAETPSGGVHRYIAPLGVRKAALKTVGLAGIDLQAGNDSGGRGYVYLPPTVRTFAEYPGQALGEYRWVRYPMPGEVRPGFADDHSGSWLRTLLQQHRAPAPVAPSATATSSPPPPGYLDRFWEDATAYQRSPSGSNGDTTLFRLVCRALEFANAGWLDREQALSRLNALRELRLDRNGEGQDERDWGRIIRSAERKVGDTAASYTPAGHRDLSFGTRVFEGSDQGKEELSQQHNKLRVSRASDFRLKRVRWLWHDRIPIGEITLVAGREGVGKSTYLADLAAKITTGRALGEYEGQARSVIYLAQEDSWSYTIAPRLIAAGADLDRVLHVESVEDRGLVLPYDCGSLADVAIEHNVGAIMCDPIISLIDEKLSTDRARELRQALEPLRRSAEHAGVAVIALVHFNKGDGDVLTKISGSRGWVEVARAAIGLVRDEDEGRLLLGQIKNNLGRLDLATHSYSIQSVELQTDDGPTNVGRLVWGEKVDRQIHDVFDKRNKPGPAPRNDDAFARFADKIGRPASIDEWHSEFHLMSRDALKQALRRAHDKGAISNPSRGFYGPGGVGDDD